MGAPSKTTAANLATLALWFTAFSRPLAWWGRRLAGEPFQLLLAVIAAGLLGRLAYRHRAAIVARLAAPPSLAPLPLAMVLVAAPAFLAAERWLDVSILSASLFSLGTYGLFGLYASETTWRRGAPVALLLMGLLPVGAHLDAYGGFVLRALSADVASSLLDALGVQHVSSETILVLENGVAHVDIPCSGIRGLWTGALFFLVATILARRELGVRFVLVGALHAAAIVAANIIRVTAITLIAVEADLPRVASIVHEPLGLLGFMLAGAMSWALLRGAPARNAPRALPRTARVRWVVALTALLTLVLHSPRPKASTDVAHAAIVAPAALSPHALALTAEEIDLFSRFGASGAAKYVGVLDEHPIELVLVDSTAWRAHHPPELCLAASGHRIQRIEDVVVDDQRRFRLAKIEGDRDAIFWFQSAHRTTGRAIDRIFSGVFDRGRRWVLVSTLVDDDADPRAVFEVIANDLAAQIERNSP